MKWEMFERFMHFFDEELDPALKRFQGKKVTILGGYAIRVGSAVYEYELATDSIVRIK